ncbi:MAG TPA: polysaccharide pyruvyl transferase family protein [Thermoanaerobaculia bacterium]|nr:polysaccharide pyruvyl transferase family protein [Thermoanaerobaculia bacterium]HRS36725.1 polysaccharide pyruvyl transferase family protein [Thermoanaerobaculia bacterium]HRU09672.1 polysaccharide pyruvyl transferase family protein [Thermoanaerobaculia bacterium]
MLTHKIGLLWDALSENTGDIAVGVVARRCLKRLGFSGRVAAVHPGRRFPDDLALLWIAGGELLHPIGHPYYDCFRQPGQHVLFGVGTNGRPEGTHLAEYLFSSVRSRADREALLDAGEGVEVVPCVTLLIDEHAEPRDVSPAEGRTLVHLHAGVPAADLLEEVRSILGMLGPQAALLSFTAYNSDFALLEHLSRATGLPLLRPRDPDEAFAWIRSARAVVSASLHATIFAYVAGVPFLTLDYAGKIGRFLDERGLSRRRLGAVSEIAADLEALSDSSVDWHSILAADRAIVKGALEKAAKAVEEILVIPQKLRPWCQNESVARAHSTMIRAHAEYGFRIAERVGFELEREAARSHIQHLERELSAQRAQTEELRSCIEEEVNRLRVERARANGPIVQVVIVFSRDAHVLDHCLRELLESVDVCLRVVIVRNGAQAPQVPDWSSKTGRVGVLDCDEPVGFAAANNAGISHANRLFGVADYLLFLNDDVAVRPEAIRRMVDHLMLQPACGVLGPRLVIWGAEDHLNSLGLNVTMLAEAWDEGIGQSLAGYGELPESREVVAVTGAALMIRPELFRAIGGWNEVYGFYYEDIDLCLRAWRHGFTVRNLPEAVMAHRISATAGQWSSFKRYLSWRNQLLVMAAHWPPRLLARAVPRYLMGQLGVFVRRLRYRCWDEARLQARAWAGGLIKLPELRRNGLERPRSGAWLSLLRPAGSVPEIVLPETEGKVAPPFGRR